MPSERCSKFEECNAPLCPQDKENHHHIWFPDEEICSLRRFQSLHWVKKQKSIAQKHGSVGGFFNVEMLNALNQVHKGIAGANPDEPLENRADLKWIRDLVAARDAKKTRGKLASASAEPRENSKL